MTSIDSLVKSNQKLDKRNSFRIRKVQENFEIALSPQEVLAVFVCYHSSVILSWKYRESLYLYIISSENYQPDLD